MPRCTRACLLTKGKALHACQVTGRGLVMQPLAKKKQSRSKKRAREANKIVEEFGCGLPVEQLTGRASAMWNC